MVWTRNLVIVKARPNYRQKGRKASRKSAGGHGSATLLFKIWPPLTIISVMPRCLKEEPCPARI